MFLTPKKKPSMSNQATQNFIPIKEVRDGIVVLKDGGLRAIIMVSSLNFDLKSDDEQNALVAQFQNLLNSLEFSMQLFIQSRELDIQPYLNLLEGRLKEIPEELLQVQTKEYIEFIKWFTEQSNIMRKSFFVVVPYGSVAISGKGGFLSGLLGGKKKQAEADFQRFEEARSQLEQRVSVVQQGLSSIGVRGVQLGTQEAIEVYYKIFNPGDENRSIKIDQSEPTNQ